MSDGEIVRNSGLLFFSRDLKMKEPEDEIDILELIENIAKEKGLITVEGTARLFGIYYALHKPNYGWIHEDEEN